MNTFFLTQKFRHVQIKELSIAMIVIVILIYFHLHFEKHTGHLLHSEELRQNIDTGIVISQLFLPNRLKLYHTLRITACS